MAYKNNAQTIFEADELAKVIDIPDVFRGAKIQLVGPGAQISKNGIVYYPFQSEDEVMEWIDASVGDWWDDEEA
jgi:hypothetical protein